MGSADRRLSAAGVVRNGRRGGPFLESKFFGDGVGIGVKRGNDLLRQAFNWALFRLWESGRFTDLWLRYFPISPF